MNQHPGTFQHLLVTNTSRALKLSVAPRPFGVALSLSLDWHERFCIDVFSIFLSNFVSGDLALTDFKFLRWTSYFHCFETLGSRAWCPNSAAVSARGQNSATSAGLTHGQWLLRFHSLGVAWKGLAIVFPWVVENQPMLSVCQPSSPRLTLSPALQVWWAAKKQIVICNKLHDIDILCACCVYCLLWEFEQQSLPIRVCNLSQVRVKKQNLATESLSDKFLIKKRLTTCYVWRAIVKLHKQIECRID